MNKTLNKYMLILLLVFQVTGILANEITTLQANAQKDLHAMIQNIQKHYAYADKKNIDWQCLKKRYYTKIQQLENKADAIIYFEHLLLEFADSHMILNTNIQDSYRTSSPISIKITEINHQQTFILDDFWQTQLIDSVELTVGAQLLTINDMKPMEVIKSFPTLCLDKTLLQNQQWIINKSLAGQYSEPRIIELLIDETPKTIDLDQLKYHETKAVLNTETNGQFGIITINNSLGKTELIQAFDEAIEKFSGTDGLILDLRNTISGGDTYIAGPMMGRLIKQESPYQTHRFEEQREGGPKVTRLWTEYVSPRAPVYDKPLVVLVNRWTGSMGEGLAIGLHGMQRGHVIGSQMAGLLGAIYGFQLDGMGFGYQIPAEQLFHVDGTPREDFIPDNIIKPNAKHHDIVLTEGIKWLQQQNKVRKK